MIRRILAVGEPQKICSSARKHDGDARTDSDCDLLLVELSVLPTPQAGGPLSPRVDRVGRRQGYPGLDPGRGRPVGRDVPNALVTEAVRRESCSMSDRYICTRLAPEGAHDLHTSHRTLKADGPYDTNCFRPRQPTEKSLKVSRAFLHGQPVPRTPDLEELQRLCSPLHTLPVLGRYDFSEMTATTAYWCVTIWSSGPTRARPSARRSCRPSRSSNLW